MPPFDTLPPYSASYSTFTESSFTPTVYDSIFKPLNHAEPVPRKSLFTHHMLPVQHPQEIAIGHNGTAGWYLGGIALSFLLLCLLLRMKQLHLKDLMQSLVSERTMTRVLRESNLTHALSQAVIAPIILLPLCLVFSCLFLPASGNEWLNIANFAVLYAGCCGIYFMRNGIIRFLGSAFLNEDAVHIYLTSNYIYHLLYGVVAVAFAFFICFAGSARMVFFYIAAGLIGILFVMRFVRGMKLILTHAKTPKVYLFYYLCTLEIVPIIVLTHLAIS